MIAVVGFGLNFGFELVGFCWLVVFFNVVGGAVP